MLGFCRCVRRGAAGAAKGSANAGRDSRVEDPTRASPSRRSFVADASRIAARGTVFSSRRSTVSPSPTSATCCGRKRVEGRASAIVQACARAKFVNIGLPDTLPTTPQSDCTPSQPHAAPRARVQCRLARRWFLLPAHNRQRRLTTAASNGPKDRARICRPLRRDLPRFANREGGVVFRLGGGLLPRAAHHGIVRRTAWRASFSTRSRGPQVCG